MYTKEKNNILIVSHMFPNKEYPLNGLFVKEQLLFLKDLVNLSVIAPVPFFPFINFTKKYRKISQVPAIEEDNHIKVVHPRYFFVPKFFKSADAFLYRASLDKFFVKFLKKNNVDILHFHWGFPDALAGIRWAKRFSIKTVLTVHGNESICFFENSFRKKMMVSRLKNIDHIIAVSNDLKNKILKYYDFPEDRITVITNGVDPKKFYSEDRTNARKECGLDLSCRYILTVARLSEEKGIKDLLNAFSNLKKEKIKLIIAGDGPLKNQLIEFSKALKINDKVNFLGAVLNEDLRNWYNAADIFCLPSLWEGLPCTIAESLACGTPVVATKVGGIPDRINKGNGILVPPSSPDMLSVALVEALAKKWDRKGISDKELPNSLHNLAVQVVEVYKKVLGVESGK